MNDSCRIEVLHAAEDLVDQELDVVVRQFLSLDNVVQVGPHQRADQVHVSEVVQRRAGGEHVQQVDDLKIENKNRVGIQTTGHSDTGNTIKHPIIISVLYVFCEYP